MNFLFTLTSYPPSIGGAQMYTHLLVQNLMQQHQAQVVCFWDRNRTDWLLGTTLRAPQVNHDYVVDGVSVHRIGLSGQDKMAIAPYVLLYYPFMQFAIPPISARIEPYLSLYADQADLINNVRIGREPLSYASLHVARKRDIPFVLTPLHHPRWIGRLYQAYIKLYQQADAVIALTNAEKHTLTKLGVQEKRIFVTGIGPHLASQAYPDDFLQKYSIRGPVILFLGQHYPYKGFQKVLQATELVWEKVPEACFVFIGPSVGNSEQDFELRKDPRILRLGAVDLQEKTNALAACSLLCVPSTQESFGGVYIEAWSFAKPVIGCKIPATTEVISDGVDGYLVEQDTSQISDCILQILLNPGQAETMGENGKRKVEERFTWRNVLNFTEEAYRSVL